MIRTCIDHGIAATWGGAEATVFFIVPDVWTSWLALHHPARGFTATLSALAGALAGGAVNYRMAQRMDPAQTEKLLASIPGISHQMIARVERELDEQGWSALVLGPTRGVPYKIYARTLAHGNASFGKFLGLSVPARMGRFVAVTAGVAALGKLADRAGLQRKTTTGLFLGGWAAFYTWYFTMGPGNTPSVAVADRPHARGAEA